MVRDCRSATDSSGLSLVIVARPVGFMVVQFFCDDLERSLYASH
jgi:hypothetical protein